VPYIQIIVFMSDNKWLWIHLWSEYSPDYIFRYSRTENYVCRSKGILAVSKGEETWKPSKRLPYI